MIKICVVTATRAEYGILKPLLDEINSRENMKLQLIVTGTHLESEYGYTYRDIESDCISIDSKIEIYSGDSESGIINTMSNALLRVGLELEHLKPDILVLLGDRYEMPPIALSAVIQSIPIAHINGGDITEGAYDEYFRHCLTKLSNLHFTTTEEYRKRVIQMGEQPEYVFNVGSLSLENIKNIKLLNNSALNKELDFFVNDKTFLVTFHPVTLEKSSQLEQFKELLRALQKLEDYNIIFTRPNADTNRKQLNDMIDKFVYKNSNRAKAFESLGTLKYLSVMKYCFAVVGNSSSGITEAPSMKVPTINIGNRQKGRIQAKSIFNCVASESEIIKCIYKVKEFRNNVNEYNNPYEKENTSKRIVDCIERYLIESCKNKNFFDLNFNF